jgi:hypothetical protein
MGIISIIEKCFELKKDNDDSDLHEKSLRRDRPETLPQQFKLSTYSSGNVSTTSLGDYM